MALANPGWLCSGIEPRQAATDRSKSFFSYLAFPFPSINAQHMADHQPPLVRHRPAGGVPLHGVRAGLVPSMRSSTTGSRACFCPVSPRPCCWAAGVELPNWAMAEVCPDGNTGRSGRAESRAADSGSISSGGIPHRDVSSRIGSVTAGPLSPAAARSKRIDLRPRDARHSGSPLDPESAYRTASILSEAPAAGRDLAVGGPAITVPDP